MTLENEIEKLLREDAQLGPGSATLTPLTGGVSSEVFKVSQKDRTFVVKRALKQLRVQADWQADISRNQVEFEFYKATEASLSGSVPKAFFSNPQKGYFTMECFDDGWSNWKSSLMSGDISVNLAHRAGEILATLHAATWCVDDLRKTFDTTENFRQLRTSPYLRTAAEKHPVLRDLLMAEAYQLEGTKLCLVHGDFSPKNFLYRANQMVLLDAEVACFGDPAFDVAFLQTHLFLKEIYLAANNTQSAPAAEAAWNSYREGANHLANPNLELRCTRLTACLLLSRVDGKSPVEYLLVGTLKLDRTE